MREFYIVPTTTEYHEVVQAETREEALEVFTDQICSDMSAYFAATDKMPVHYPHSYEKPKGKYEKAMTAIVDTMVGKTDSQYYRTGNVVISMARMAVAAKLQMTYDNLKEIDPGKARRLRKQFYKLLCDSTNYLITGEDLNKKSSDLVKSGVKIVVSNIDWDHEGRNNDGTLPDQVVIEDPSPDLLEDINGDAANLAEYLTEKYECCICGFVPEVEGVEGNG